MFETEKYKYVPTGVFRTEVVQEWWCPSSRSWTDCPGPCPDGVEHAQQRERLCAVQVVKVERKTSE